MKKNFLFILLLILILNLTGCTGRDAINDKTTGQIDTGSESKLQDGTYTATAAYYNSDGYKESLTIEVHNGILSKANFTETNAAGDPRTEPPVDYPKTLTQLYRSLITKMIRNQKKNTDIIDGAETLSGHFNILSQAVLKQAELGDTQAVLIPLEDTYTIAKTWDDNTTSILTITWDDTDTIVDCSYSNTDIDDRLTETKILFQVMSDETLAANTLTAIQLPVTMIMNDSLSLEHYNAMLTILDTFRNTGF